MKTFALSLLIVWLAHLAIPGSMYKERPKINFDSVHAWLGLYLGFGGIVLAALVLFS